MRAKSLIPLLSFTLLLVDTAAAKRDFNFYHRQQKEKAKRALDQAVEPKSLQSRQANYRYYNNKTAPYFIEKWPDVNFDTGEFYSGSVRPCDFLIQSYSPSPRYSVRYTVIASWV
jgi:hypothetical protein